MMFDMTSINTPFEYYVVGYTLAVSMIILLGEKKRSVWFTAFYLVLFALVDFAVMHIYPGGKIFFWPVAVFNVSWIYLAIRINCVYEKRNSFYLALSTFMLGEFISSNEWMFYYFAIKMFHYPTTLSANILMVIVIDGIAIFLFGLIEKRVGRKIGTIDLKMRDIFSALLTSFTIYCISNVYYLAGEALFGGVYASELFVIRTLVDMGGISILYAFMFQLGEVSARLERDRLQDTLLMQQSNYELLEQAMELVNIKYHDLKHQIALFRSGIENGETLDYLDKMEQEIKIYEAQNKTGNRVLDTILTAKSIHCQNHWIEMTVVADGDAISFMEDMDISALFSNMIDNAIECVEKIEHKEKKLIHLAVAKQKGFVRIRLENCYDQKPVIVNGRIKTTKSDQRYHGYGMKSIEAIVKKYGGSMTVWADNGWFEQRILIPVK